MTPAVSIGLVIVAVGILSWSISSRLSRAATRSYAYLRPTGDKETFRRGNIFRIRAVATVLLLTGLVSTVYALATGR